MFRASWFFCRVGAARATGQKLGSFCFYFCAASAVRGDACRRAQPTGPKAGLGSFCPVDHRNQLGVGSSGAAVVGLLSSPATTRSRVRPVNSFGSGKHKQNCGRSRALLS